MVTKQNKKKKEKVILISNRNLWQLVPAASYPITVHLGEEFGFIFSTATYKVAEDASYLCL